MTSDADKTAEPPEATEEQVKDLVIDNSPMARARRGEEPVAPVEASAEPAEKPEETQETAASEEDKGEGEQATPPADPAKPAPTAAKPEKPPEAKKTDKKQFISADTWAKLPHADKSAILARDKETRTAREEAETLKKQSEALTAKARALDEVSQVVRQHGLQENELLTGIELAGALKRKDQAALQKVMQANGISASQPGMTPELEELIKEAEGWGVDTSKVKAKYAPATAPAAKPAEQPPAKAPAYSEAEENTSYTQAANYLAGLGCPAEKVDAYLGVLVETNPYIMDLPPAKRPAAVHAAHVAYQAQRQKAAGGTAPAQPTPAAPKSSTNRQGTPISGGSRRETAPTNLSPLEAARRGVAPAR
jgi:hypothetical protein